MTEHSIPVDLLNPGQVFACLGFLEAADVLCGEAQGGFYDWDNNSAARFRLSSGGDENPFEAVLEFLATEAKIQRIAPRGYVDPPPKKKKSASSETNDEDDADSEIETETETETETANPPEPTETFMAQKADKTTLPIRLGGGSRPVIELGHWADGSGRETFKLYSGNRSADKIARDMLNGVRKPTKEQKQEGQPGPLQTKGIEQLFEEDRNGLISDPFRVTPMGGSFNFDPRGAWTAIDAGYSPNTQKHAVTASPVVEFLAAWGLQDTRPLMSGNKGREVRYAVWKEMLTPMLARAAFSRAIPGLTIKCFRFTLALSGKNKIVTFAKQEKLP